MTPRKSIEFKVTTDTRMKIWLGVSVLSCGFLLLSAASPLALSRADAEFGRGQYADALSKYEAISNATLSSKSRDIALERAALIYSSTLHDDQSAIVRLKRLSTITKRPSVKTNSLVKIGQLLLDSGDSSGSISAFMMGYTAFPETKEGQLSLSYAARAQMEAGQLSDAIESWERLLATPTDIQNDARLGLAEAHVALGNVELALPIYRNITNADDTSDAIRAIAQLGMGTCLDRMGYFDEAVAELDEADLPGDVFQARSVLILERSNDRLP